MSENEWVNGRMNEKFKKNYYYIYSKSIVWTYARASLEVNTIFRSSVVWSTSMFSWAFTHTHTPDYLTQRSRVWLKWTKQLRCESTIRVCLLLLYLCRRLIQLTAPLLYDKISLNIDSELPHCFHSIEIRKQVAGLVFGSLMAHELFHTHNVQLSSSTSNLYAWGENSNLWYAVKHSSLFQ